MDIALPRRLHVHAEEDSRRCPAYSRGTKYGALCGVFLVIVFAVGGCCGDRTFLCRNGTVSIETRSSDEVEIRYACVWQTRDKVVVYGHLRRRVYSCCPMEVRLDAVVLGPDGSVLEETCVPRVYVPWRRHGCSTRSERFKAILASVPPKGSRVIISVRAL